MPSSTTPGLVAVVGGNKVAPLPGPDLAGVPVPSTNFPPGMIPQLVKEKNKTEVPYTPIDQAEIEKLGG